MVSSKVVIQNQTGLHARPASDFVNFVKTFEGCKIEIENADGKRVKASSLLKILSLGIKTGSELTVHCDGEGEQEVLEKVVKFMSELED